MSGVVVGRYKVVTKFRRASYRQVRWDANTCYNPLISARGHGASEHKIKTMQVRATNLHSTTTTTLIPKASAGTRYRKVQRAKQSIR